jgi:thiazole synthase
MSDDLRIGPRVFHSRLLIGTARYPDFQTLRCAIDASGAEIITVAIRRMNLAERKEGSILQLIDQSRHFLLPNTAGCYTARDAILSAQLAREALETNWIKLEVIGDDKTLFPDSIELLKAADALVRDGFVVLAYCNDDPIVCQKLADLGCAAIMPLGSPIGSGLGLCNLHRIALIRKMISLPLIIDAGIGTASDAVVAMELGADAVLVNTAIAEARYPIQMAAAFQWAVQAGRNAYLAGRIPKKFYGAASTPLEGRIACGLS